MTQLEEAVSLCEQTLQQLSSDSPEVRTQGIESAKKLLKNPYISSILKQKLQAKLQALETAETVPPVPESESLPSADLDQH